MSYFERDPTEPSVSRELTEGTGLREIANIAEEEIIKLFSSNLAHLNLHPTITLQTQFFLSAVEFDQRVKHRIK